MGVPLRFFRQNVWRIEHRVAVRFLGPLDLVDFDGVRVIAIDVQTIAFRGRYNSRLVWKTNNSMDFQWFFFFFFKSNFHIVYGVKKKKIILSRFRYSIFRKLRPPVVPGGLNTRSKIDNIVYNTSDLLNPTITSRWILFRVSRVFSFFHSPLAILRYDR